MNESINCLLMGEKKQELQKLKNPKPFIDYSQTSDDVYESLEDYNPTKNRRVLMVFDDMIPDMEPNKKLSPIVTELFLRKLKTSRVFILKSYFKVAETITLNATHHFIMKIPNRRELQQIVSNHSSDIDFKVFMKLYKDYFKEPYSCLMNDKTLPLNNPLRSRKNLL